MKKRLITLLAFTMLFSGCQKTNEKQEETKKEDIEIVDPDSKKEQEDNKQDDSENKEEETKEETNKEEVKQEETKKEETKVEENKKEENKKEEVKPVTPTPTPAPTPTPTPAPSPAPTPAPSPAVNGKGVTIGQTSRTVIIDAGHGGSDPGASSGANIEKNITLTYALAVGSYLSSKGVNVVYTRTGDYELARSSYTYNGQTLTNDLTARSALGYANNAAIYCSIHIDSASAEAHGFSCFYNPKYADSLDTANLILSHLSAIGYTRNRGLLDGTRLRSIRGNSTIAVMVELGFIQSSDIDYINANVPTISAAIGDALIEKLNKGWSQAGTTIQPDLS